MDVKDAILSRRTIFKFKQEPVPNDVSVSPLQRSDMFIVQVIVLTSAPAERYVYSTRYDADIRSSGAVCELHVSWYQVLLME